MKKSKNIVFFMFFCCFVAIFSTFSLNFEKNLFANNIDGEVSDFYVIVDENDNIILEKSGIEEGDRFVTSDFQEYEIYKIDGHKAYAKKIGKLELPNITKRKLNIQKGQKNKKICLYLTHNDESYTPSDGYSSIYGAVGVHDVAKAFKKELENKHIEVVLDETLHIPHDSNAYTRSSATASKLFNNEKPDAMFDIHRDGVSKSFYYTNQNGEDLSKIRIVVGKSNPNFEENYQFAKKIFALGNSMYPWLFSDIYCGKGHYNQKYQNTDLLFEMGTYLIEKEFVFNSLPYLADVVNVGLYGSQEKEGEIVVDQDVADDIYFVTNEENNKSTISPVLIIFIVIVGILILSLIACYLIIYFKKDKNSKKVQKRSKK